MSVYRSLEEVVLDRLFPDVDTRLREGAHLSRDDRAAWAFLDDAFGYLEPFYLRFGFDLVRADSGYVFLRPNRTVRRSLLSNAEMLVGQALALLLMDPGVFALERRVSRARLRDTLQQVVGDERLLRAARVVRSTRNEAVEAQKLRKALDGALKRLERLGFVRLVGEEDIELRMPLYRFVDAVRGAENEAASLTALLERGEVVEGDPDEDEEDVE